MKREDRTHGLPEGREMEIPAEPPSTYRIATPATAILYSKSRDHTRIGMNSLGGWSGKKLNLGDFCEYVFLHVANNWATEKDKGTSRERSLRRNTAERLGDRGPASTGPQALPRSCPWAQRYPIFTINSPLCSGLLEWGFCHSQTVQSTHTQQM